MLEIEASDGRIYGPFASLIEANEAAQSIFGDIEQGEGETSDGWDVRLVQSAR